MKSKFNTATPIFATDNKIWNKDCAFMDHGEPIDIFARSAIAPLSYILTQIESYTVLEVFANTFQPSKSRRTLRAKFIFKSAI